MKEPYFNSPRFSLSINDMDKSMKNAVIFFAPAALLFLMSLQSGNTWNESIDILLLWIINTGVDLTRKFIADNRKMEDINKK
jgi:hypothetical protein